MTLFSKWLRWATQILHRFIHFLGDAYQWLIRTAYPKAKRLWAVMRVLLFSLMCIYADVEGVESLRFLFQLLEMML